MNERSMSARSKAKSDLPPGLSTAEEARWWDEHPNVWDNNEDQNEVVGPSRVQRTKPVNLRLPVEMIATLKREAAQRALPYQTLIRMWLKERLNAEGEKPLR
jgi:predicted DNA binding CopG/RHH family protein